MGKSLYIARLAQQLAKKMNKSEISTENYVTIPLHGPVVTPDTVLELFVHFLKNQTTCIYHIDIAPSVSITRFTATLCVILGRVVVKQLF